MIDQVGELIIWLLMWVEGKFFVDVWFYDVEFFEDVGCFVGCVDRIVVDFDFGDVNWEIEWDFCYVYDIVIECFFEIDDFFWCVFIMW